ncbi:hypothetical protein IQ255_08000 [Pleurocapsales cyanobacterium LEGE 10410]|nr:hypothetical protein [Pleurocapsales cyanobacterium LEGE 10410]
MVVETEMASVRFAGGYKAVRATPTTTSKIALIPRRNRGGGFNQLDRIAKLALASTVLLFMVMVEGKLRQEGVSEAVKTPTVAAGEPGSVIGGTEEERLRVSAQFGKDIAYWKAHYPDYIAPVIKIVSVEEGIKTSCGNDILRQSAYCHTDRLIAYFPELNVQRASKEKLNFERSEGYTISHEVAHSVQYFIKSPGITQPNSEIKEQEADCLAGRSIRAQFLQETDTKTVEIGIDELLKNTIAIGDYHNSHGTGSERAKSFLRGYESGICF